MRAEQSIQVAGKQDISMRICILNEKFPSKPRFKIYGISILRFNAVSMMK